MSVFCQQLIDGEAIDPEWEIEPPEPGMSDTEILAVKAASAADKDWDVEWIFDTMFVARRIRWTPDALCERVFRIG
jgi:hypothetical protein